MQLEVEKPHYRVPTLFRVWKARREGALSRVSARPGVVIDPGMYVSSLHGNREISGSAMSPQLGAHGPQREGDEP